MALSTEQIAQLREHLDECKKPLFFFDDDQDGVCSFLQLYRYKKEGKGVIIKTTPKIGTVFVSKVEEYMPDKLFILDLAVVEQEFLDEMKVPVIWIDHHGPFERNNVKYFNPRISKWEDNHPVSYMCYQIAGQDLWISTLGCIADWFIPPFLDDFKKDFPELIGKDQNSPGEILYNSKLGHLVRVFSFILKGKTSDVMKSIKVLTRIETPFEILNQESAQGKFIYKRYEQVNKMYEPLIKEVLSTAQETKEKLIVFKYKDDQTSFTSDLSNEAIYRFPDRIILVAREKNDEMKCSLRSGKTILPPLVEKCLIGLEGYGGGHEMACGLNIKTRDFDEFVERLRNML